MPAREAEGMLPSFQKSISALLCSNTADYAYVYGAREIRDGGVRDRHRQVGGMRALVVVSLLNYRNDPYVQTCLSFTTLVFIMRYSLRTANSAY